MTQSPFSVTHAFELAGGPVGVLLIHGLTGTPAEMRVVARGLNRAGYTVHCMQLAGHCGSFDDLLATTWQDWRNSVRLAAERLQRCTGTCFVGGLSMGAVLALDYAALYGDRVAGVLALAPVFDHDGWSMPWYARLGRWILPPLKRLNIGRRCIAEEAPPYGIKDIAIRQRIVGKMHSGKSEQAGLPGTPWFALAEMYGLVKVVRHSMRAISCPCLVIHSDEDDVAGENNALLVWGSVSSTRIKLVWLSDSYHMVTIDRERRKVIDESIDFIRQVSVGVASGDPTCAPVALPSMNASFVPA